MQTDNRDTIVSYIRAHYLPAFAYEDTFSPHFCTKTDGNYLIFEDDRKILDLTGQLGAITTGNGNQKINDELINCLKNYGFVWEESFTSYKYDVLRLFFEEIFKNNPCIKKIRFFNTGSEAVEAAIQLAKETTGREIILTHTFAYHGWTAKAQTISDFKAFGKLINPSGGFRLDPEPSIQKYNYPFCQQCPFDKDYLYCKSRNELYCIAKLREKIKEIGPDHIAAVFTDCALGLSVIFPPKEFIKQFAKVIAEFHLTWIDDEIFTGGGRMGQWFAFQQHSEVTPDIICFGKGITNGLIPASGIAISQKVTDQMKNLRWELVSTFAGNPLAMAVLKGNIEFILENNLLSEVRRLGRLIESKIKSLRNEFNCISSYSGTGFFWGIELVKDRTISDTPSMASDRRTVLKKGEKSPLQILRAICLEKGLLIGGYAPNTIRITPPLTLTAQQIEDGFSMLWDGLKGFEQKIKLGRI